MALVTAPQPTIPDFEHEYHTVIVDTTDQESAQMTNGITVFYLHLLKISYRFN